VAKQEVTLDVTEIGNLLKNCRNDNDIFKNATEIEQRIHKLKGLAPMMGYEQIGEISVLVDKLLKITISGKVIPGIYDTVTNSHNMMQNLLNGVTANFTSLKSEIEEKHKHFLH
jgi:HPt (histidine-containing phosphotransfer) domain-containing protein